MDTKTLERFRHALTKHRETLLEWIETDSNHKEIRLGGTPSNAVIQIISELKDALMRIDRGEFGKCQECNEDVEPEYLALDYTKRVCLAHYSEEQLRAIENDLELAAKVQRQLLPRCIPALPGVQMAIHAEPAHIVGGDFYDFFAYEKRYAQGIVLADVMGKGLPASLLMSNLQASLRILGPEHDELPALAVRLNKLFRYNLTLIRFISLFLGRFDIDSKIFHYCNAGHNPPLWWQAVTGSIKWLNPTGPAIGLTPAPQYTSNSLQLNKGDLLLLYTDGLIDARNTQGEEFGEQRLVAYVKDHINEPVEVLLSGLRKTAKRFAGSLQDDMTLILFALK